MSDSTSKSIHPGKTAVVDRAVEDVLQGGTRDRELNDVELNLFNELVARIRDGDTEADGELWKLDYIKPPPTIAEFILDEYYLGRSLKPVPGENEGLWPGWQELFQRDFDLNSYVHNLVITGSLGIGKCWGELDELVLFDGSTKRASKMQVGDLLMGPDSKPRRVLSVSRGQGQMYEIHPLKGEPFTVNEDHVLVLKSTNSDTVTEVTVRDFLEWPRERRHKACLFRVGVDWRARPLPIDPYIMGLWIGDGHAHQTSLTTASRSIRKTWIEYAKSVGLTHTSFPSGKNSKADTIQLSFRDSAGTVRKGKNQLRNHLQKFGLMLNSVRNEKFIPRDYLTNSRKNRLELLAGLIDTDGHKAQEGCYEITFKFKRLAADLRFLAQSLGYHACTKIQVVNSTAYYRTIVSGAYDVPTRLAYKRSRPKKKRISNLTCHAVNFDISKSRFAVIPLGTGDYYGFTLTGDGRCLMRDFTVTHNTYSMVLLMLYRICIATHLKNPQNFFGISRGSRIIYNFLSVTKEAVRDTAFGDAMGFMAESPYFLEVCHYDPEMDYSGFRIPLLNTLPDGRTSGIWLTAGSKGQHLLGRNVIGVGLDEGNFRLEKDPDLTAYTLYDAVRTRISNRFQKLRTFLPALSVIASSAADESSFTEKVVAEIEEQNRHREEHNAQVPEIDQLPPTQLVYRNAVYRIKRHALQDIGPDHRWFRVAYGLKNMEPYILEGWYRENGDLIGDTPGEEAPKGSKTELVPEFYLEAFRRNCRTNLQALSGISVSGAHRLFATMIDIEWCIAQSEITGVPNSVIPGVERISVSSEDNANIWDSLVHRKFVTRAASRHLPLRHPERLRYAHIDLATQNLCGLAICHLVGAQIVTGLVKDGEPFEEYRLIVEYDFILTICAGTSKPISIEKIQNFFFWLRDMCGFRFGKVTADMFQSEQMLQNLESKNFEVDKLSLDRDKSVYHAWRMGFEERRIRLPRNAQMVREAEQLLEMDKKYDHPPDGCFTGETEVRLLNGTAMSLKAMADQGGTFWVYGNDGTGKVIPVKAYNARRTKTVATVLEVALDNGKTVRCTPDHKFMLRDGSYARADCLVAGTRLMPLYTKLYRVKYRRGVGFYEQVHSEGNWRMTHRLVAAHFGFDSVNGHSVIHHRDLCPRNNEPENLENLSIPEHNRRHALISEAIRNPEVIARRVQTFKARYGKNSSSPGRIEFRAKKVKAGKIAYNGMTADQKARLIASTQTHAASERTRSANLTRWKNTAYRRRQLEMLAQYARSENGKSTSSKTAKSTNSNRKHWTGARVAKHRANVIRARKAAWDRHSQTLISRLGPRISYVLGPYHAIALTGTGSSWAWKNRLKQAGIDFAQNAENLRGLPLEKMQLLTGLSENSLSAYLRKIGKHDILHHNNHKVVSVRPIHGSFDVYDLSIEGPYENFALMAGISVHNSKDTCDGAAGAYYNAITSEETKILTSVNAPTIITGKGEVVSERHEVPVAMPLPAKGYTRLKSFDA